MDTTVIAPENPIAFPHLDESDLAALRPLATPCSFADVEIVFRAGQANLDLFGVETGEIEIINPSDDNRHVVTHGPRQFAGDIDSETGVLGLKVVGPGKCRDTMLVREFLFKNFVPFTWYDSTSEQGKKLMADWGSPKKSPVIGFGDGRHLINPGLRELAQTAGVWQQCPVDSVDLAIIGVGPAGMTAAVYAASEGVSTVVLDRFGPGGQASGSSKIENFIGFPNGLSGAELAMRSVLQMLKFGARMVAPVVVEKI